MKADINTIRNYFDEKLSKEELHELREMVAGNREFAQKVLEYQSQVREIDQELLTEVTNLVYSYKRGRLQADDEISEYLKFMAEHPEFRGIVQLADDLENLNRKINKQPYLEQRRMAGLEDLPQIIPLFAPHSILDSQVEKYRMAAGFRSVLPAFEVISPYMDETIIETARIPFYWKYEKEAPEIPYIFKFMVLNNLNNIIRETDVNQNYIILNPLKPGTYYWKLIFDDIVLHVGKFHVL